MAEAYGLELKPDEFTWGHSVVVLEELGCRVVFCARGHGVVASFSDWPTARIATENTVLRLALEGSTAS